MSLRKKPTKNTGIADVSQLLLKIFGESSMKKKYHIELSERFKKELKKLDQHTKRSSEHGWIKT